MYEHIIRNIPNNQREQRHHLSRNAVSARLQNQQVARPTVMG
jgi:hypothetical protein